MKLQKFTDINIELSNKQDGGSEIIFETNEKSEKITPDEAKRILELFEKVYI